MIKIVFTLGMLFISLYADQNITNSTLVNPTVIYNVPDAVIDTNKSKWNTTNWGKKMSGDSEGAVGNTMLLMNDSSFMKSRMTDDTSELTVEATNEANISSAASGFTDDYRTTVMTTVTSNTAYSPKANDDGNTLKCFMARDLPFRYKCEETGLVYGGSTIATSAGGRISNMDGMSGKEALNLCKENCKRQVDCRAVGSTTATNKVLANKSFSFSSNNTYVATYSGLSSTQKTKYLTFNLSAKTIDSVSNKENNNSKVFMDISYIDQNDKTVDLIKQVWIKLLRGEEKIDIRSAIKSIKIKLYSEDANTTVSGTLSKVSVDYEGVSKYICVPLQDTSLQNSEAFAYKCPAGSVITFGAYQICSAGTLAGDNSDGTYSDKNTCTNQCNITKKCSVEMGSFDATIFEQMREGRLGRVSADGSFTSASSNTISSDVDCTNARAAKQKVQNEVAFDSKNVPYQTVLNGVLVQGVDRPRVLSSSNVNYEIQKKEEWKDSAYQSMLLNSTFSSTLGAIGSNTQSHFAYSFQLATGSNYGNITSTSRREFIWKLKPNALFYDNTKAYRLYSVVKVDVEKYGFTANGRERIRDQIWYVKTSTADTFTPFLRAQNYATATALDIGSGNISPTLSYNPSASFNSQTFNNQNWINSSLSNAAPSFKTTSFLSDEFWYEFIIFDSIGDIIYKVPGLIRSSTTTNGGVTTNSYSGTFDGTGDGVAGYEIYTFFSENSLTLQDLKNKIDAIDRSNPKTNQIDDYGAKIYKSMEDKFFSRFIDGDNNNTDSNIDIFQYGSANNNSLKVRINPRKEDIGKNGFVYIFVY